MKRGMKKKSIAVLLTTVFSFNLAFSKPVIIMFDTDKNSVVEEVERYLESENIKSTVFDDVNVNILFYERIILPALKASYETEKNKSQKVNFLNKKRKVVITTKSKLNSKNNTHKNEKYDDLNLKESVDVSRNYGKIKNTDNKELVNLNNLKPSNTNNSCLQIKDYKYTSNNNGGKWIENEGYCNNNNESENDSVYGHD